MEQLTLLRETRESYHSVKKSSSGTFVNNMKLPIHRWFRYSAGFNADWVAQEIHNYKKERGISPKIVDPFVGSGTVLIEADKASCHSIGIESHPFISRIAKIKLLWHTNINSFDMFTQSLLKESKKN